MMDGNGRCDGRAECESGNRVIPKISADYFIAWITQNEMRACDSHYKCAHSNGRSKTEAKLGGTVGGCQWNSARNKQATRGGVGVAICQAARMKWGSRKWNEINGNWNGNESGNGNGNGRKNKICSVCTEKCNKTVGQQINTHNTHSHTTHAQHKYVVNVNDQSKC